MVQSKTYWGVLFGKKVVFRGTFSQCWENLTEDYSNYILGDLAKAGIRIARIA